MCPPPLACVSRLVRAETLPIFFRENKFLLIVPEYRHADTRADNSNNNHSSLEIGNPWVKFDEMLLNCFSGNSGLHHIFLLKLQHRYYQKFYSEYSKESREGDWDYTLEVIVFGPAQIRSIFIPGNQAEDGHWNTQAHWIKGQLNWANELYPYLKERFRIAMNLEA